MGRCNSLLAVAALNKPSTQYHAVANLVRGTTRAAIAPRSLACVVAQGNLRRGEQGQQLDVLGQHDRRPIKGSRVRPPLFFSALPSGRGKLYFYFYMAHTRDAHILRVHIRCACTFVARPHSRMRVSDWFIISKFLLCPTLGSREALLLLLHGAHARCA